MRLPHSYKRLLGTSLVLLATGCGGASGATTTLPSVDWTTSSVVAPLLGDAPRARADVRGRPTRGPADAPVTIVEFSDFQCPFCARVQPTLDAIRERYGERVRFAFVHLPLAFHDRARPAAAAAIAAYRQRGSVGFYAMHDRLFAAGGALEDQFLDEYAGAMGLDLPRFAEALHDAATDDVLDADADLARSLGIQGTPSFLVNGRLIVGAVPLEDFTEIIDDELRITAALVNQGVPRASVYDVIMAHASEGAAVEEDEEPSGPPPTLASDERYRVVVEASEPMRGPADALVTLVEYSDYQCPFCARVEPTLRRLLDQYGDDLRLVPRDNPLPFHAFAMPAAIVSREALRQRGAEAFWSVHDALYESTALLDEARILAIAGDAGLDVPSVRRALDDGAARTAVEDSARIGQRFGAHGTPSFFINGRLFVGARPIEQFRTVIDEELAEARALVESGVPRSEVYAHVIAGGLDRAPETDDGGDPPPPEEIRVANIEVPDGAIVLGGGRGVTMHVVLDYQCPFSARLFPDLMRLLEAFPGSLRVVVRDYPLPFHPDAQLAGEAVREVAAQLGPRGYARYAAMLFEHQRELGRPFLESYARQVGGVNLARFRRALDEHIHAAAVEADAAIVRSLDENLGTPSSFVDGLLLRGALPYERFETEVRTALAEHPHGEHGDASAAPGRGGQRGRGQRGGRNQR